VLRLARVLLASQYATMLEYRAEIALWALSGVLPFIMFGVWSGVAGQGGAAAGAGLDPGQLARYFLAVFLVRQFTIVWVIHSFEEDLVEGRLSAHLLQPLPPVWRHLSAHLAEQATRLPFAAAMAALFVLVQPAAFRLPPAGSVLLGVLAIHLAFLLRFTLQYALAMACFWSERATALDRLLYIPYLYLSGLIAPLDTYPEAVRRIAMATPFPAMVHLPARLLAGQEVDVASGFAVMAAWAAVLAPLCWLLWRAGLRRHSAMGA
jgi:ABC-2 type transport system permease protein